MLPADEPADISRHAGGVSNDPGDDERVSTEKEGEEIVCCKKGCPLSTSSSSRPAITGRTTSTSTADFRQALCAAYEAKRINNKLYRTKWYVEQRGTIFGEAETIQDDGAENIYH
ncbi:hypothetical protein D8B26_005028 [Coccidioides posadasii str. Silveira]|uniref:Uncharacterized protein n=1 Tax=Coccidioides posadasii (strain RMSCC 757 / Silveira) TaxID=443226 RepID=E9D5J4_COCPS|nr:hypothetical protein CPSG_04874 [Coccidioides posadasii str. Silveira]QVM10367.1 hypothetical protein D8B26_005028 [Coccidioides posadasii str. Silveira]